jgi:hypothetical protein
MTWEEAKQKVAEKYGFENVEQMIGASLLDSTTPKITDLMGEAANLMQESNLARIKELEDGLKSALESFECLEPECFKSNSDLCFAEIVSIKQLLCTE